MQIGTKTVQSMQIGNKTVQNIITSDGDYLYDRGKIDITIYAQFTNMLIVDVKTTIKGQPSSQSVYLQYTSGDSFTSSEIKTTTTGAGTARFTVPGTATIIIAYTTINGNEISKQVTLTESGYSSA